jgi:hypothetical protein
MGYKTPSENPNRFVDVFSQQVAYYCLAKHKELG